MSLSVIICAYTLDRWDQLVLAVESLGRQTLAHEVILVSDHNDELFARAVATWPEIVVLANDGPRGLSGARNRALREATGDIAAFLDDDAWADEQWLERLAARFDDPRVVAVGGAALPIWPVAEPAVLPPELLWVVGCSYRGLPAEAGEVRNVMGCSMAFRRAPLLAIGGFNPDTGRVGTLPVGCEETEACILLRHADPRRVVMFEPAAVVHHHVSPDRVRLRYVLRRSWCEGISKAAISRTVGSKDSLSVESAYVVTTLAAAVARSLVRGPRGWTGGFAIVMSVLLAGAGYLRGSLSPVSGRAARGPAATSVLTGADA